MSGGVFNEKFVEIRHTPGDRSSSPRHFCGICRSFWADFWCATAGREKHATVVQLLDLAMGVLAAAGIKLERGHLAAEGSVQLGISIGEDRKLVVLDEGTPPAQGSE